MQDIHDPTDKVVRDLIENTKQELDPQPSEASDESPQEEGQLWSDEEPPLAEESQLWSDEESLLTEEDQLWSDEESLLTEENPPPESDGSEEDDPDEGEAEDEMPIVAPTFHLKVSPNRLTAHFFLRFPDDLIDERYVLTEDAVLDFINKNGVKYEIRTEALTEFCEEDLSTEELLVSEGLPPVDGQDGIYVTHFDTEMQGKPKELPSGDVDYRDLSLIQNAEQDELLCTVVHPTPGIPGCDVYGNPIAPKPGKPAAISSGPNVTRTVFEEEGNTLFSAAINGCVKFVNGTLSVETVYVIQGDVGPKTGHVDFNGNVTIKGNVIEGFSVTAEKDIHIVGRVEGCSLTSGGNIVVEDGIAGMEKAVILARGNLTAKFIENAKVISGGDIYCDIVLQSSIKVGGSLLLSGQRAGMIGGDCLAGCTVEAKTLGSIRHVQQSIAIIPHWQEQEAYAEEFLATNPTVDRIVLLEGLQSLKNQEYGCTQAFMDAKEQARQGHLEYIEIIKRQMELRLELERQIRAMRKQIRNSDENSAADHPPYEQPTCEQAKITCTGVAYPGVKIIIGRAIYRILEEMERCFFIKEEGDIYIGRP